MRVLIGALVLGLCAWYSAQRLEDWRSDRALFAAAVAVTPDAPRPALNYGAALVKAGHVEDGLRWTLTGAEVARERGDIALQRQAFKQLLWIDVIYAPVCDRPDVRLWCVSP